MPAEEAADKLMQPSWHPNHNTEASHELAATHKDQACHRMGLENAREMAGTETMEDTLVE
jgi:hypothetical protein